MWWTLGSPPHPRQLNAVIKADLDLLECDNPESQRHYCELLWGFGNDWPKDGQDLAETSQRCWPKPIGGGRMTSDADLRKVLRMLGQAAVIQLGLELIHRMMMQRSQEQSSCCYSPRRGGWSGRVGSEERVFYHQLVVNDIARLHPLLESVKTKPIPCKRAFGGLCKRG